MVRISIVYYKFLLIFNDSITKANEGWIDVLAIFTKKSVPMAQIFCVNQQNGV